MPVYICLDPGSAHTGIAISHEGLLAEPLTTIFERDINKLTGKLVPIIALHNPKAIVIGRPHTGPIVKFSEDLKEKVSHFFAGDIILYDENISTKEAKSILSHTTKSIDKRRAREHMTAAAVILQRFLDD